MDKTLRLQVIFGAIDRLTRPLRAVSAESKKASAALKAAGEDVRKLNAAARNLTELKKLREEMRGAGGAIDAARRREQELQSAIRAAEAPTARMRKEYERARQETARLVHVQGDQVRRFGELKGKLADADVGVRHLADAEADLQRRTARANDEFAEQRRRLDELHARQKRLAAAQEKGGRLKELGGKLRGGGAVTMAAGVGAALPMVGAAKAAMSFEDAMADVKKVANFKDVAQEKAFSEQILLLSQRLPVAAAGLGQIAAEAKRAGVPLDELITYTELAAKMTVAFDMTDDPGKAGEIMAAWRNAFDLNERGVAHLGDQLNALTNKWGGHADNLVEIVTRVGNLAKGAGLNAGQTGAFGEVLNSMKVEPEVAATSLQNLFLQMGRGEAATKKMKKTWTALGLDAVQMAKLMQKDAAGAITLVLARLNGLEPYRRNALITQLFGKESIQGISMLVGHTDKLREALALVNDPGVNGSMNREYAARAATTSNALQLLKNDAMAVAIELGTMMLPAIKAVSGWLGRAAVGLRAWIKEHPRLAQVVGVVLAVLAGLLVVGGALAVAFGAVMIPLAAMTVAFAEGAPAALMLCRGLGLMRGGLGILGGGLRVLGGGVGLLARGFLSAIPAVVSFGVALLTNPITWIVLAVAALAAVVFLVIRNWSTIGPWLGRLWATIKGKFAEGIAFIFGLQQRFAEFGSHLMMGLVRGILGGLGAVKDAIFGAGEKVVSWFKGKLGIKSPSRVFAQLGVHTMDGLAQGLHRSRDGPLRAVARTAAALAAAGGAVSPAVAAVPALRFAPPSPVVARSAPSRAAVPAPAGHQIHVHAAPGMDERALARAVAAELDRRERETHARTRSRLGDYGD